MGFAVGTVFLQTEKYDLSNAQSFMGVLFFSNIIQSVLWVALGGREVCMRRNVVPPPGRSAWEYILTTHNNHRADVQLIEIAWPPLAAGW